MRIQEIYKYPFYEFYHTLIGKHQIIPNHCHSLDNLLSINLG